MKISANEFFNLLSHTHTHTNTHTCRYIIPYNSLADIVRLLAELSNTKSNEMLGGFRSQLQASFVSSHTEELWYNERVCLLMTIYIYIYIYNETASLLQKENFWIPKKKLGESMWLYLLNSPLQPLSLSWQAKNLLLALT